jgi:hypothetical protein
VHYKIVVPANTGAAKILRETMAVVREGKRMLIRGNLTVWSEVDAGTEVELCVSCGQRLHDSSERFLVVAKLVGKA